MAIRQEGLREGDKTHLFDYPRIIKLTSFSPQLEVQLSLNRVFAVSRNVADIIMLKYVQ